MKDRASFEALARHPDFAADLVMKVIPDRSVLDWRTIWVIQLAGRIRIRSSNSFSTCWRRTKTASATTRLAHFAKSAIPEPSPCWPIAIRRCDSDDLGFDYFAAPLLGAFKTLESQTRTMELLATETAGDLLARSWANRSVRSALPASKCWIISAKWS